MRKSFLFILLAWCSSFAVFGQNNTLYTVQVGTFLDARLSDFEAIRPYGYVYADALGGNQYEVFVGKYDDQAAANTVLGQIKSKGYRNAFLQQRLLNQNQTVTVIQLATKSAKKPIDWETYLKAGKIYAILNGDQLKVVTGIYNSVDEAKKVLGNFRSQYKGAFVKNVNTAYLHEVTPFETGVKEELIPLALNQPNTNTKDASPSNYNTKSDRTTAKGVPDSYDISYKLPTDYNTSINNSDARVLAKRSATNLPDIRAKIKRTSVLELQKVLKAEKTYSSSLDGYYGSGTKGAYDKAVSSNREFQKYAVLAEYLDPSGTGVPADKVQQAINNLPFEVDAQNYLQSMDVPAAWAYRAYLSFTNYGPSGQVNDLMNSAIRGAYANVNYKNRPPFDYNATYAYKDLEQLILHLHYVHAGPNNKYSAPCWLFQAHPAETAAAYQSMATFADSNIRIQACDEFLSWAPLRITQAIAADLNVDDQFNTAALAQAASLRAKLYLSPRKLSTAERQSVESWNRDLWNGLNGWSTRDPMHQKIVTALKISFFQSQVLLEDYYMDKGFKSGDAEELALATLQTLVGYHLERFI
jgi:hypothetical protein